MQKKLIGIIFLWIISVVSILCSIVAVCRTFCRNTELQFDYMGVIVAIFSLLVTLLVGWNIISVIDLKSYKRKYENLDKKISGELNYIHNKADHNQALVYAMMSQNASAFFAPNENAIIKYQMLLKGLTALKIMSNFPVCEKEISALTDTLIKGLENSTLVPLGENLKTKMLLLCGEIANKEKIPKLDTIIELIKTSK